MTTERIYEFIVKYYMQHGYAPSFKEIMHAVGLRSVSTVKLHMDRLFKDGRLETDMDPEFKKPRAFRVAGYKLIKV